MTGTGDHDPGAEIAWQVFARHSREPALHQVGEVRASSPDDAVVFAWTLYDERRWDEMFVVRADDVTILKHPA